jgi:hypothetical protein
MIPKETRPQLHRGAGAARLKEKLESSATVPAKQVEKLMAFITAKDTAEAEAFLSKIGAAIRTMQEAEAARTEIGRIYSSVRRACDELERMAPATPPCPSPPADAILALERLTYVSTADRQAAERRDIGRSLASLDTNCGSDL